MPFLAQQHPRQTSAVVPLPTAAPVAAPASSASSPVLLPITTPPLPAEHLRELKRQLAKSSGAAEAYLQTLDREEAALLLCEVLRHAGRCSQGTRLVTILAIVCASVLTARVASPFNIGAMWVPVFLLVRGITAVVLAPPAIAQRAAEILAREAQPALTSAQHAGPLLDAFQGLEVMRRRELQTSRARIVAALARLLPRLTASESASVLTPKRRATLRHALRHAGSNRDAYPADLTVVALLALATARDERAAVPAMRLRSSPSERIQAAAEECLRALEIIP